MNVHVRVKATPGASKELVKEMGEHTFEIYVREPAQKNMANRRVCAIIAAHYGVPPRNAHIETGHRSRNKTIRVTL